ncbi:MAG: hypothetical protein G01um101456_596 [Parcubacteria group bacterium Gr01-1014_56]|nr:MAG: hypothetical protein G01um101456_596 [Parcubacteria group bacterium Gr01-1014_56]
MEKLFEIGYRIGYPIGYFIGINFFFLFPSFWRAYLSTVKKEKQESRKP